MTKTAHIINNQEIGLAECGLLIEVPVKVNGRWSEEPVKVLGRPNDVATWDNMVAPSGHYICGDCWTAYNR